MNTDNNYVSPVAPTVREVVIRGRKHIEKGIPCQDFCCTGISSDGWIVMAVADGVSSSPHSEDAAKTATQAVIAFWKEFNTYFSGESEVLSALQASMNYALMETDTLRNSSQNAYGFETTLSIVLVIPQKKEMYFSYVGDGGIYLLTTDGHICLLTDVMRDDEGSVTTLSEGPGKWKFGRRTTADLRFILMVTDGISDVIRSKRNNYQAAKLFMNEKDSIENYRSFCQGILREHLFCNMDDDAAIVLYALDSSPARPWSEEITDEETRDFKKSKGISDSAGNQGISQGIRKSVKELLLNIKINRRKK